MEFFILPTAHIGQPEGISEMVERDHGRHLMVDQPFCHLAIAGKSLLVPLVHNGLTRLHSIEKR